MYKFIITALIFLTFSTHTLAQETNLPTRTIMPMFTSLLEPPSQTIERVTNRWKLGKYVVRVIISGNEFENLKKYIFNTDPSGKILDVKTKNIVNGQEKITSVTIPIAQYPLDFVLPIKGKVKISQEYGKTSFSNFHTGIDFSVLNIPVFSVSDGKVIYSGKDIFSDACNNGGNMIKIAHNNGLYSAYFHLKELLIKKDSVVKIGDKIGISGNSGKYNCMPLAPHLHFEIRTGMNQLTNINPRLILPSI